MKTFRPMLLAIALAFAAGVLVEIASALDASPDPTRLASEAEKASTEKADQDKPEEPPERVQFDAVFASKRMTAIRLRTQEWTQLRVLSAAPHGRQVRQGAVLLTLDAQPLDNAIADLRNKIATDTIALAQARAELAQLEQKTPIELAAAERSYRASREDYAYFTRTERALAYETAEFNLLAAQQRLEYEKEELEQLEKMYHADDLTEETEAIVLKRARNSFERAEFGLKQAEAAIRKTKEYELPRQEKAKADALKQAELTWAMQRAALPAALKEKRLAVAKLELELARSKEKLARSVADRKLMVVRAPADGIVYYGPCKRGKFDDAVALEAKLTYGATAPQNDVLMTIVAPQPLELIAMVSEAQVGRLAVGQKAKATPVAAKEVTLGAIVSAVSRIPLGDKYEVRLAIAKHETAEQIMPGMTAKVEVVP